MKKLVHLADLHLGATLHDRERLAEQKHFLDWFCGRLAAESPRADLLVVAGDVFDGRDPSPAARTVWYDFLARLRDPADPLVGAVVAVAGNHDSAPALRCAGALARHSGIRIVADGPSLAADESFAVPCADGGAFAVAAVPFLRESRLREEAPAGTDPAGAVAEGFRAHFARAAAGARAAAPAGSPLVVVGHCAVRGAKASDAPGAEIRVVGTVVEVPASVLPPADCIALGHLHVPQAVPVARGAAFYAGAPYPVGTGELATPKSVPFVSFGDDGSASVERRPVDPAVLRRIRAFEGTPDEIAAAAADFASRHPGADAPEDPVASAWFTATVTAGTGSLDELAARLEAAVAGTGASFFGLREGRDRAAEGPLPSYDPATFARLDPAGVAALRFDAASVGAARKAELLALVREAARAVPADPAGGAAPAPAARVPARILSVCFSNLNSLKGRATVDFEELRARGGTFAVAGNTGAGKTTILDAITLALYGRTARQEGELTAASNEVMNRGAAFCRAAVRFRGVDGRVYRAVWAQRRKRRAGNGGLAPYRHELWDETGRTAGGAPECVCAGGRSRDCIPSVAARIGFTYDEFTRIVLLAQGRFDQFLKASEETRAAILEKVVESPPFGPVGAEINRRKLAAADELLDRKAAAGARREELERAGGREALAAELSAAETAAETAAAGADALRGELAWTVRADRFDGDRHAFERDAERLGAAEAAFAPDRARLGAARRAAALLDGWHRLSLAENRADALAGEIRRLDARIASVQAGLPGLRKDDEAARAAVAAAQAASASRKAFLDDIDARDGRIAARKAAVERLGAVLVFKRAAAADAAAARDAAREAARAAAGRAGDAEAFWTEGRRPAEDRSDDGLFRTLAAARDARNRIAAAAAPLPGLADAAETAEAASRSAKAAADAAAGRWKKERAGLELLRNLAVQAESADAATMRAHLVEGRPCPVCGAIHRKTADSPVAAVDLPPSSEYAAKIEAGDAAVAALAGEADRLLAAWRRAAAAADGAKRRLDEVRKETDADVRAAAAGVAAARQDADTKAARLPDLDAAAADAEAGERAARGELDEAERVLAGLEEARAGLYGAARTQDEREELAQAQTDAETGAAAAAAAWKAAQANLAADREERTKLDAERTRAKAEAAALRAAFEAGRASAGFATDAAWKAACLEDGTLRALEATERALHGESVRLRGPDGTGGERARLDREEAALAGDPDRPAVRRAAADVRVALAHAEDGRRKTGERVGEARKALEARDRLAAAVAADDAALEPLEKAAADWKELDRMLGGEDGKAFRLFAQRLNFRNLVRAADPHLQALSGGRYRFAWSSGGVSLTEGGRLREDVLRVVDAEQDGARPVSNLSGGESFFASLALALGFAALHGGGAGGNLFLDEGFGTLDAESLDAAVDVLGRIGSSGTLVGVVTHVGAVVAAADTVVEAVRKGNGTGFLRGPAGVVWSDDPGAPPTAASADG